MEAPSAMYQLIILYMLHRAGDEIALPMVSGFLIENGYVDFESLLRTYGEIEANGYVVSRKAGEKTFMSITAEGEQTLEMFRKDISGGVCRQVDAFLTENGRKLREDRSVTADYYKASYGGYTAHLSVKENKTVLVSIDLNMPTEEAARQMTRRWKEKSGEIYHYLISELL